MKGWWKMAIFHLKHSHLNWRGTPCRKKKRLCLCNLFNIFWIWLFWFLRLDSNRISQVHDMTIKFSFIFFYFFRCFFYDLFVPSSDMCHIWLSRLKPFHTWKLSWTGLSFGPKGLFTPFLSIKKGYGSKGFCFCQQKGVTA